MTLSSGTKLGAYEIQTALGSGGMGEVYRAHDSSLKRDVAIKVLPTFVSSDPDRLRRFEQEARAAAALNHPNILAVYQLGIYEGAPYLVSELLEGTTLREQIRRGPLPPRKVIDYGVQIARGLAAAHDKGIVHRDLKPENIFVTKDGRLKILDFGLAKLTSVPVAAEQNAPTVVSETGPGMVLGTVGYMSPEQVRGLAIDHRTDIFAFGAILYEMVSGKRAFQKTTSADTMSAVLNEDPPAISQLAPMSPPALQRVVHRCLEKNPEQRFQSASDLAFALEALSDSGTGTSTALQHPSQRKLWPWIAAAAFLVVAAGVGGWWYYSAGSGDSGPPPRLVPFTSYGGDKGSPRFSPDGNQLAFMWQGEHSENPSVYNLYVQIVGTSTPLQVTKSATWDDTPAWSPDGRFIAFWRRQPMNNFAASRMSAFYVVPALGGPERKLAEGYEELGGWGLSWSPDGKYLAVVDRGPKPDPNAGAGISFISTETGERTQSGIVPPAPYICCTAFSPDGKYLAFGAGPGPPSADVYVVSTAGGKPRALSFEHGNINGIAWTPDGRQLIFDSDHLGLPTLWRVSASGGPLEAVNGATDNALQPTIASHGNRLAFQRYVVDTNIWKVPLSPAEPQPAQKLIDSTGEDSLPSYSPDGQRITFASSRSGSYEIYVSSADGKKCIPLTSMKTLAGAPVWAPDGKEIAFDAREQGHWDVFVVGADGGTPRRITNGPQFNAAPSWSRDGKWIYFTSNRSGGYEIWKLAAAGGDPIQITRNGGFRPLESADGKFLYYYRDQAVWRTDPDGRNERRMVNASNLQDYRVCGNNLCVLDRLTAPEGRMVIFDPATGRQQVKLVDVGARADVNMGIDVSPDAKWLIYSRVDSLQSDIMMVENFH